MESFRNIDSANEQLVARFLDENFYLPPLFDKVIRVSNKEEQLQGIDVIVSSSQLGLENAIIDEKDTAHYVNKDIPTFAFELSFLMGPNEIEGWLTDLEKKTEYYLCLWPFAKVVPDTKPAEFIEITKLRYMLVKREDVLSLLQKKGFDRTSLLQKAKEMRNIVKGYADSIRVKEVDKAQYGFYFMYTYFLKERPVNVVIPRKMIEEIAIISGFCEKKLF